MNEKLDLPSNLQNMSLDDIDKYIISFETLVPELKKLRSKKNRPPNSLETYCEEYMVYLKSYASTQYVESVDRSLKYLMDYFGIAKSISEIGRVDVNNLIAELREHAPKGYRVYYRNLKAAFNVAIEWEYIEINPFAKVKLPRLQKEAPAYINKDQLELILESIPNKTINAMVHYAFYTGSRRLELLNLRWRNIDFKEKIITIGDESFQTKTRTQRKVPMAQVLFDKLWILSDSGRVLSSSPDKLVFAKPNGFPYHEDTVTKAFKKACRKVGVDEKIHFHSVRHSFASYLVQKKVGLYNVRDLMGHSSVTTTEIYAHLNTDALQESIKVFDD